jgi:Protein of unknown function (DUF1631)
MAVSHQTSGVVSSSLERLEASKREHYVLARDRLVTLLSAQMSSWALQLQARCAAASEAALNPTQRAMFTELAPRFEAMHAQMGARLESHWLAQSNQRLEALLPSAESNDPSFSRLQRISASMLAQLDDSASEHQALLQDLAQAIRVAGDEDYVRWLARLSTVLPGLGALPELDEAHPLGALTLASALIAALRVVTSERNGGEKAIWPVFTPWLNSTLASDVAKCIAQANETLRSRAILPSLSRAETTPTVQPVREAERAPAPIEPSVPVVEPIVGAELAANNAKLLPPNVLRNDLSAPNMDRAIGVASVKSIEADAVAFAHNVSLEPYSRNARRRYFGDVHTSVARSFGLPAAAAVVDVVAALFDYAVDDQRLPASAKPLLWRLQQPVTMLALLDSRYLAEEQRSARDLVENIAAIAIGFGDDLTPGSELFQRLDTAVRAVEIVASMLQSRAQVLAEQVDKHFASTAKQVAAIATRVAIERQELENTPQRRNRRRNNGRPSREREHQVTDQLQRVIDEKLTLYSVPDSVSEFLRKVWVRHLRSTVLRDGEDSGSYKTALRVVDDLLWSADLEAARQSRRQLSSKIPPLIGTLTAGSKATGASEPDYRAFFDELYLIHLRKLQPRLITGSNALNEIDSMPMLTQQVQPAPATSQSNVQAGFDEMARTAKQLATAGLADKRSATEEAGQSGSGHLLDILAQVQVDDFNEARARLVEPPEVAMAMLELGMWVELDDAHGQFSKAKLAWINTRRTVFLFLRHPDRRPMSVSASELLTRLRESKAYVLA